MSHSVEVPASVSSIFMLEHQKNTVNCVASGKEEHVTVTDVYEMSQTENNRYRWKHAFQFPSVFPTLPNRSLRLNIHSNEKEEFDARIRVDCAETAVKLKTYAKKYIAAFEENSMDIIGAKTLKKRLQKESASDAANNILLDVFTTMNYNQHCNQSHLSLTPPSASADTNVTIFQDCCVLSQN